MSRTSPKKIAWILNGCGLESDTITGSPIRFQAISSRWKTEVRDLEQILITTPGGARMLRKMGCALPMILLPASVFLKKEPFKAFRLWSYVVTSCMALFSGRRLPQAEIAITVSDYFCNIVPALVMKRKQPGLKWIAWIHHKERPPSERPGNRWANELTSRMQAWSFRRIAKHADQAWVSDTDAGEEIIGCLQSFGMPEQRIRRIQNGIDLSEIQNVPAPGKTVDAVMIGVRPNKGAADIARIWTEVQKLRPGTTLRLMGGIVDEEGLRKQFEQAKLDPVIRIFRPEGGWLAPERYYSKIKEARLLFAPSHEEGWGIALCEAMACGLPVVAYDLPAYRKVYGRAVETVPVGDFQGMAGKICALLEDAERYESAVARGHACAARYDWGNMAREDWAAVVNLQDHEAL